MLGLLVLGCLGHLGSGLVRLFQMSGFNLTQPKGAFRRLPEDTLGDLHYPVIFSHFPFVFNTLSKIKLLYADSLLKIQENKIRACMILFGIMEQEASELVLLSTFNLTVRRSHLIEDVLRHLYRYENEDLRREIMVSFSGEIEHDFEGVRAEFFHCLFEEMTRPEYGMFIYPEEAPCIWFPVRPKFENKRYYFFGVLCGLSLFNCNVANIPFPLGLFKKLLDQIPSLEDLKELSPILGKKSSVPKTTTRGPSASAGSRPSGSAAPSGSPVYLDLAYLPRGGSTRLVDEEFFRRVAHSAVISGQDQSKEEGMRAVLDALLAGKQQWDHDLQGTDPHL
ncbi:hypothetical protein MC885_005004 [Smutsia gigantea]|nr:hypothetical protein MC885_005004 [Smutsia gigantea]